MIREKIGEWMNFRGINQVTLCAEIGFTPQNFNAFLKGKRGLPIEVLKKTMEVLNITVAGEECNEGTRRATEMSDICKERMEQEGKKIKDVCAETGLDYGSVLYFFKGTRNTSIGKLEKILSILSLGIKPTPIQ